MENIQNSIIAILRGVEPKAGVEIAQALLDGGIDSIEVSQSNGEDGLATLRNISQQFVGKLNLGAGTVTTRREADDARAAGAKYLITPGWDRELSDYILSLGTFILPGVYSPGEIMQAQAMGIFTVKLFPAHLSGIPFVKAMQGPFPHMRYIAVGGVTLDSAAEMLQGGFYALGIGSELVPRGTGEGCYQEIKARADAFVAAVRKAEDGQ